MNIEDNWKNLKEYHSRFAKQRTDAFNFSLILLGLVSNAIVTLSIAAWNVDSGQSVRVYATILCVLAIFIIIAAFMFWGVDFRTSCFLHDVEKELLKNEAKIKIFDTNNQVISDLRLPFTMDKQTREDYDNTKKKCVHAKFGTLIKFVYLGFIVIGVLTFAESIYLFCI